MTKNPVCSLIPADIAAKGPQARYEFMKSDSEIWATSQRADVRAENTFSPTLTTQFLEDAAVTKLQNRLAALSVFSKEFGTDRYKPRATTQTKFVDATDGVVQTNGTNFEQGDTTIAPVTTTVNQVTRSFHVTNDQQNSGLRMENLLEINIAVFADAVIQIATAPMTSANFTLPPIVRAPGAFGWGDMQSGWGMLKKTPVKNAVLDGEYLAQIINVPTQLQKSGVTPGPGWGGFGWDNIALNTNWTGAEANVRGFICGSSAIGVVAGLPLNAPFGANTLDCREFLVPGIQLSVAMYRWFSLASRTLWYSFDVMIGASMIDATAGILIKSA